MSDCHAASDNHAGADGSLNSRATRPTSARLADQLSLVRQHERIQQATGLLGQVQDDLSHSEIAGIGAYLKRLADEAWQIGTNLLAGDPNPGICRLCGCTMFDPCEGGCAWVDTGETLCSSH